MESEDNVCMFILQEKLYAKAIRRTGTPHPQVHPPKGAARIMANSAKNPYFERAETAGPLKDATDTESVPDGNLDHAEPARAVMPEW